MISMIRSGASLFCLALLLTPALASDPTTMRLWENGAPGVTAQADGDTPELIVTRVDSDKPTAGVIILPGGGYGGHAIDHEGHQFAEWFQSMGVTSAICTYRLRGKGNDGKGYGHPVPMMDAQRAIQTMRAMAKQWNVDPNRIGVIGFSAGGHLCSTVSTKFHDADPDAVDPIDRVSSRPDFSILCYPVITMDSSFTHAGSRRNLLGSDPEPALVELMSNEKQITDNTPPTFLFHTVADQAVPVRNSLAYFNACVDAGVVCEMHVFPNGRHGLGLAKGVPGASQWPALCETWLRQLGMVTK
ncbi:Acetylxylan esterase precursor [Rubripirellula lacrimiformis]|uniref:Acetylxylan esterase n=1 Tax=Rubripirellula lacrimiformis TaxID=1930273 RepID=A0A517N6A1_9BACT|nr:alpha/beta hydrolase [Rubripirellula lacrimiformis]QDT02666.1 Acetylxylan esterase precursor [Rubripirellula lacrimiformis]